MIESAHLVDTYKNKTKKRKNDKEVVGGSAQKKQQNDQTKKFGCYFYQTLGS